MVSLTAGFPLLSSDLSPVTSISLTYTSHQVVSLPGVFINRAKLAYAPSKPTFGSLLSPISKAKGGGILVLSRSSMQVGSLSKVLHLKTFDRAPGGKAMNGLLLKFHYLTDLLPPLHSLRLELKEMWKLA